MVLCLTCHWRQISLQGVLHSASKQLHSSPFTGPYSDPPRAVGNAPADLLMPAQDTD